MYVRLGGSKDKTKISRSGQNIRFSSETVKSLEHLNETMSDSDSDVPELVPSSDEEEVKPIKTNDECVDIWLSKNVKFLDKQEHNVRIFSLGPLMLGLDSFISKPWLYCMFEAKLIGEKKFKEKAEYTKLSEEEWQNLEIIEVVTKLVIKKMRKKNFLINTLNMIDDIEANNRGDGIDVKHSIQTATSTKYTQIQKNVWDVALSYPEFKEKKQKVKFSTLYVCKLCHMMITSLAREGKDMAEDFKKSVKTKSCAEKAIGFKDQGNEFYSKQKYKDAIEKYTLAVKADPFNHLCYGNRAQGYQKQNKNYEALADGRRAVLMKPDWIKGYYRYAQAFYHTNNLNMAIAMNKKGLKICEKSKDNDKMLSELREQGHKLHAEKLGNDGIEKIEQLIAQKSKENYNPSCSGKRKEQDASALVSSGDQDSTDEESITIKEEQNKKETESKKQTKDPDIEKLTLKPQSKKSKGRKSNHQEKQTAPPVSQSAVVTATQEKVVKKVPDKAYAKNENTEIEKLMAEGSLAYLDGLGKKAVSSYQKALDLLSGKKPEDFGLDDQDVAVLEYAYGVAEISTGIFKHILEGIDRLKYITETFKDSRLPLPYFGLGKAYVTLNRFEEAVEPLNKCLKMAANLKLNVLTWPGTDTKMEESMSDKLQSEVKQLLTLTKYPPPPDGVCKLHTDVVEPRTVIFFSDPDFKGFIRIACSTSCIIEFHNQCWRDYKSKFGEKTCDKDILDKPCPTPDCMSCIVKIVIFRQDSLQKEIVSDKAEHPPPKPKKPSQKHPPSSLDKIEKKKEKKELRKQKKKELKEEANDLLDDLETDAPTREGIIDSDDKDLANESTNQNAVIKPPAAEENTVPVVKRQNEEYKGSKPKAGKKKNKKKKEKGKQVLNVEVNFGDDSDKQLLGEDDVEDQPPEPVIQPVVQIEENFTAKQPKKKAFVPKVDPFDEIVQNLFLFFEDLLKAHGPLHIHDAKITTMVDDFPQDARVKIENAGGLSKFLLQSTKFAMHGEVVCMREDAHKASKISRQQSESFASKASKLSSNNEQKNSPQVDNVKGMGSEVKALKVEDNIQKADFDLDSIDSYDMGLDSFETSIKSQKVSSMDTLDDFDFPVGKSKDYSKKTSENSKDFPELSVEKTKVVEKSKVVEKTINMDMDELDDIDLIPVTMKNRRKKKTKGMDDLDDFDLNISDSESTCIRENMRISDIDNIGSKDETFKIVGREKMDLNKLPRMDPKSEYSMSRSSSKSDLSERSDLSAEMKFGGRQKMPDLKPQQNSKSMWPARNSPNTFGPIGSPVPSEKNEIRLENKTSIPPYSSYMNSKNESLLLMDPAKAAEREKFRIDSQYVKELADQVMKDITFGKNFTEKEHSDMYKQVTEDIWTDFKKSNVKIDKWTPKSVETGYDYTTGKKSFNEEYMKNFYQKKTTDPSLNSETFSVETPSSFLYGNSTFSKNVSSDSGWPTTITSNTGGFSNFQNSYSSNPPSFSSATTVSSFSPIGVVTTATAFSSLSTNSSLFTPMTSKSNFQSAFSSPSTNSNFFDRWSFGISVTSSNSSAPPAGQSLNSFPSTYSSVFSNSFQKFREDKAVHAVVETRTVFVNTDPYEPLKEEFHRMKKEYQLLQEDLANALTQKQELASNFQELGHRYKNFEQEVSLKNEAYGKERQSMQEKQDMLFLEWTHINQQFSQISESEKDLKIKVAKLEEEKKELLQQKVLESQGLKVSEEENRRQAEEFKSLYEKEKERASRAEIEITNQKKQSAVAMLERSLKETSYHVHHLKGLQKKHLNQGKEIPSQMIQALSFYENIVSKCGETIPKLKKDFDEQVSEIQSGRCLADLPAVFVPPPPPNFPPTSSADLKQLAGSLPEDVKLSKFSAVEPSPPKVLTNSSGLSPISVKGPTPQPSASIPAQPRPLVPPPGIQAPTMRQQIPRLANKQSVINGQPKNSFEKLLQRLAIAFPQYNRAIFTQLIQQLRQSRGGSLSGLTIEEITHQVTAMIQTHEQKQGKTQTSTVSTPTSKPLFPGSGPAKSVAPPPGLNSTWGFSEPSAPSACRGEELFEEEQDPCVICHEEMTPDTTVKLECHHRFHDECIRKWLRENSTCPNCRIYALLPDEFPTLN